MQILKNVMTANSDAERFQREAQKYAAYLETPEGRLRLDLPFSTLEEFLPKATDSLQALDLGGGTGANAVRLARLGFRVTLLDPSPPMLHLAERAALRAGVTDMIVLMHGNAGQLASLCKEGSFDLILCHNVLEFVDDPQAVLCSAAHVLKDSSSIISVLMRNQTGEVFKAALLSGDLTAAERNLTADWADESLYGGKVRLSTAGSLRAMLQQASFAVTAERGVRVLADYLPANVSRDQEYTRILALEQILGRRPEFAAVARYTHCIAHRTVAGIKDCA